MWLDLSKPGTFECAYIKNVYLWSAMYDLNGTWVVFTGGVAAVTTWKWSLSVALQGIKIRGQVAEFWSHGDFPKMAVLPRCISQKKRVYVDLYFEKSFNSHISLLRYDSLKFCKNAKVPGFCKSMQPHIIVTASPNFATYVSLATKVWSIVQLLTTLFQAPQPLNK